MKMLSWIWKWREKRVHEVMVKREVEYVKRLAHKYLIETEGYQDEHPTRVKSRDLRWLCKYVLKTRPKIKKEFDGDKE